jgi:lipopolysaccharide export LptBFGC system permease protein LptF
LLVFGRFSADHELTAARASGISLTALIAPILVLSVLLCGVSAWINMDVAPRSRIAFKRLTATMGVRILQATLPEGRYVKTYAPYSFYIGHIEGDLLEDVIVSRVDSNQVHDLSIKADHGRVETTNQQLIVHLFNAHRIERQNNGIWADGDDGKLTIAVDLNDKEKPDEKPRVSDMTFRQLQAELASLENAFTLPHGTNITAAELRRQKRLLEEMKVDASVPVLVMLHRQVACSFACLGFTLIGIPLGIRAHRRETNIGIALALGLVLFYYSFLILGQSLQTHADLAPHLIVWIPTFIFEAVGAFLLWRANRGV